MIDFDYSVVKHYKFYGFVKKCIGPIFKVLYPVEFEGLENIPQDKDHKYIVAINHTCMADPLFASLPKQMPSLHFMAKIELFKNPVVGWVIMHLYGFPVNRGKGDSAKAIEYGEKIINEGHVMALCPEGKRIKDKNGVPQKAKSGVAIIAHNTGADVLPACIYAKGKVKPFKKTKMLYGKLLTNEELGLNKTEVSQEEIRAAADKVMDNILALWEGAHNAD